jgi:hypothetical protein
LIFNIACILPPERQRVELSGIYLFLGYTGGRSGEFVDNEKQPLNDGSLEEIFGRKAQEDDDSEDQACLTQLERLSVIPRPAETS